jgi:hypothetical protein
VGAQDRRIKISLTPRLQPVAKPSAATGQPFQRLSVLHAATGYGHGLDENGTVRAGEPGPKQKGKLSGYAELLTRKGMGNGEGLIAVTAISIPATTTAAAASTTTAASTAAAPVSTTTTSTAASTTAAAISTSTAAATTPFRAWPGLVDREISAIEGMAIQRLRGGVRLFFRGHRYECEPARTPAHAVEHEIDLRDGSVLGEKILKIIFSDVVGKISYEQLCIHLCLT